MGEFCRFASISVSGMSNENVNQSLPHVHSSNHIYMNHHVRASYNMDNSSVSFVFLLLLGKLIFVMLNIKPAAKLRYTGCLQKRVLTLIIFFVTKRTKEANPEMFIS